ncbi:DUF3077 domain-containing protein [Pseudomonas sp. FFUP_PS_473]|jgi:hypothetical protein|uniref:DUF3077 domain-containing protein n=1 Tax=Pseudomonas TaxID=286 RepID=UPI000811A76D|nr:MULTISPECIES: DUF3077 domain-containing protein [Pseudomonas]MEE3633862.1 DUF3077 domain-containing protein [Pseudomonas sp. AL 58]PLP91539.1 DUF3077 domain-containing protein [Pseudomonas sp. FFUP_PS_473]
MKKIVPDPPLDHTYVTAQTIFGSCAAGHAPLFSVCPGIAAHDVLVHVSLYLGCAYDTADTLLTETKTPNRNLLRSTLHSVEMAKGLVDALLDGIEAR